MERNESKRIPLDRLVLGLVLLVVGLMAFGIGIDLWNPRQIARLWPLFLVVLGLAGEAEALRNRKSDGSMILLAIGIWMLVGLNGWYGLSVGSALPLGVIVVGFFTALHALADRPVVKKGEKNHECQ